MSRFVRVFMFVFIYNILPSTPLFADCHDIFSKSRFSPIVEGIKYVMSHSDFFTSVYSSSYSKEEIEEQLISHHSMTLDDISHILIQKRDLSSEEYREYIISRLGIDLKEEKLEVNITLPVVAAKEVFNSFGFSDDDLHLFPSSNLASDIIEADDIIPLNEIYFKLKTGEKFALVKIVNNHFFIITDPVFDDIEAITSVFFSVTKEGKKYLLVNHNKTSSKDYSLIEYDSTSKIAPNFLQVNHNGKKGVLVHMYLQYNNEPNQPYDAYFELPEDMIVQPLETGSHHPVSFEKHGIAVVIDPFYSIKDCFDRIRKLSSSTSGFTQQLTTSDAIYFSQNTIGTELMYTAKRYNTHNEDQHFSFGTFDSIRPIFGKDDKIDFLIVSKNYRFDIIDVNSLLTPQESLDLKFPYTSVTFLADQTAISPRNEDYITASFLVSTEEEGKQTIKLRHIRNYIKNRY